MNEGVKALKKAKIQLIQDMCGAVGEDDRGSENGGGG